MWPVAGTVHHDHLARSVAVAACLLGQLGRNDVGRSAHDQRRLGEPGSATRALGTELEAVGSLRVRKCRRRESHAATRPAVSRRSRSKRTSVHPRRRAACWSGRRTWRRIICASRNAPMSFSRRAGLLTCHLDQWRTPDAVRGRSEAESRLTAMLVMEFSASDLARIRFAISPLLELWQSIRALQNPASAGIHGSWIVGTT